jgi:deferrochelatase/peroxidase EfeB
LVLISFVGAPIQLTPLEDDLVLAKDPQRNNNFVYPQDKGDAGQAACPYAAHVRKTNPRNDLDFTGNDLVEEISIPRAGIPYGPGM